VVGGVGVSAVLAARAGAARVWVWEQHRFVAAATREVLQANGVGGATAAVVEGGEEALQEAIGEHWPSLGLVAVEGLEMDGMLGSGALLQLRRAQRLWRRWREAAAAPAWSGCLAWTSRLSPG